MPSAVLDSGFPANKKKKKPSPNHTNNNKKAYGAGGWRRQKGFAGCCGQSRRDRQHLRTGLPSAASAAEPRGAEHIGPQPRAEKPPRGRERSVSRWESCGTPVSPAKPSPFAACRRLAVCVPRAGRVFAISTELSLSYEPSSRAVGTKSAVWISSSQVAQRVQHKLWIRP